MHEMTTLEDWESCLSASDSGPVLVFKHSTRCPVSARAYEAVQRHLGGRAAGGPPFYLVKVVESRPVSTRIAEALGVEHQSPQLILVRGRAAVWSTSHLNITEERIRAAETAG